MRSVHIRAVGPLAVAALAGAALAQPRAPAPLPPEVQRRIEEQARQGVDQALGQMSQRPALFGPPTRVLAGRYVGVAACGPVVISSQLDLDVSPTGVVTGRYAQRPSAGGEQAHPPFEHAVMAGYDPLTGVIAINPDSLASSDRTRARLPRTIGLVVAEGSTIVAAAPRAGAQAGCSPLTLRRANAWPDDWRYIEEAAGSGGPGAGQRRRGLPLFDIGNKLRSLWGGGCSERMVGWVAQLKTVLVGGTGDVPVQWNLFTDPYFVPFFDKPFRALAAGEREAIGNALRSECPKSAPYRDASRQLLNGVAETFLDQPGIARAEVHTTNVAQAELRRWMKHTLDRTQTVGQDGATPELVDELMRLTQPLLGLVWPSERAAFETGMQQARVTIAFVSMKKRIEAGGGPTSSALDTLEQTTRWLAEVRRPQAALPGQRPPPPPPALNAAQWAELDQLLAATLEREAPPAAARLANEMTAPVQADQLRRWTEIFANVAPRLSGSARAAVQRSFDDRQQAIETEQAASERAKVQATLASASSPADKLKALVAQARRADELISPYLKGATWAAFQQEAALARAPLLAQVQGELTQQLPRVQNRRELDALLAAFMRPVDRDSEPGRAVMAQVQRRAAEIAPFGALPAGEYFDALYAGDFRTVAQLDADLAASVRDGTIAGVRNATERLMGRVTERRTDVIGEAFLQWATGSGFSLAHPLASLFIINYEAVYGRACMGSDAREITILTTTYERGRDAFGTPYERNLGTSTRTVRVKASLASLAMTLQLDDPTMGARLLDYFRARATLGAGDVVASTRTLMRDLGCSDPRLLRLEDRLVEYAAARGRR